MWWSQLKSASIGFRFCVSNLSDSDADLPCNHSLFHWIVKQLFIDVSAAAVLIPEMTSHCLGTCTILTTRYRRFIIVRMAWRRRCHAVQTRHNELMTSLTCGEGVVSCRVSCNRNQTNWKHFKVVTLFTVCMHGVVAVHVYCEQSRCFH